MTKPISPEHEPSISFVPAVKTEAKKALTKIQGVLPDSFPISSTTFTIPEEFSKLFGEEIYPLLIQMKAMSVFTVKSLITEGIITHVHEAMTGIGSLFFLLNFPSAVINTRHLYKHWAHMKGKQRFQMGAHTFAKYSLTGAGVSFLLSSVPAFSKLIGPAASATLMKVGLVLGPAGMAISASILSGKGIFAVKKSIQYSAKEDALKALIEEKSEGIGKTILLREKNRFSTLSAFAKADASRYILAGVGIGLGAIFMASFLAGGGSLITALSVHSWGWGAVGLVGSGFVISVGTLVVQKREASNREKKESKGLAETLYQQLPEGLINREEIQEKLREIITNELSNSLKDIDKEGVQGYWSGTYVDEILNSSTWRGNPSLLDLIINKVEPKE